MKPTPGELEILNVLWDRGPSTVRDVHTELDRARGTGYTTVLKLMQIMAEKGLVRRDESARTRVLTPVVLATMHWSWGIGFLTSPRTLAR